MRNIIKVLITSNSSNIFVEIILIRSTVSMDRKSTNTHL